MKEEIYGERGREGEGEREIRQPAKHFIWDNSPRLQSPTFNKLSLSLSLSLSLYLSFPHTNPDLVYRYLNISLFLLKKTMNPPVDSRSALTKKLIEAARDGNLAVLREHVSELPSVRDNGWNASVLHLSAQNGHLECVDFISLAHPRMMRMQNKVGWTPLN